MNDLEPRTIPGTDITYRVGSQVIYLHTGNPITAIVRVIYSHLDPPRWDGERSNKVHVWDPHIEDKHPEESNSIWAYESDILRVLQY